MTRHEIFQKVEMENARSKAKHGLWQSASDFAQYDAISGEFFEWQQAWVDGNTHGEHGEVTEAIHTINVLVRRIQFLTGEADA